MWREKETFLSVIMRFGSPDLYLTKSDSCGVE